MNAFDWYSVLTPLALIIVCLNVLISCLLKPEFRSPKLGKLSMMTYVVMLVGWSIMFLAIKTLTSNVMVMTYVAIVGWLLLLPATLIITGCFIAQLRHEKDHFNRQGQKFGTAIALFFRTFGKALVTIYIIAFRLITRSRSHLDEATDNVNSHNSMGAPYVMTRPPKNAFGGEEYYPPNDPSSLWWKSDQR